MPNQKYKDGKDMAKHGFQNDDLDAAIREGTEVLAACAKHRQMVSYSDFVNRIHAFWLKARTTFGAGTFWERYRRRNQKPAGECCPRSSSIKPETCSQDQDS